MICHSLQPTDGNLEKPRGETIECCLMSGGDIQLRVANDDDAEATFPAVRRPQAEIFMTRVKDGFFLSFLNVSL